MSQTQFDSNSNGRATAAVPDPEVVVRAERRRFTAEYKRRILQAAEIARLQRDNERLQAQLERAELIIDVQKKVALPTLTGEANSGKVCYHWPSNATEESQCLIIIC